MVLLDTVGLLALWNVRDQWNPDAAPVFAHLVAEGASLYVTSHILLECANAASRSRFRNDVVELREQLAAAGTMVEPTEDDCSVAWNAFAKGKAGQPGVVDLVSFTVMHRLGITDAFTNDKHFRAAGFKTLF